MHFGNIAHLLKPCQNRVMATEPGVCVTPLLLLLRQLETDDRRRAFAQDAGTSVNYLYQLAGCKRRSCSALKAKQIADASKLAAKRWATPVISMEEIATMCPIPARTPA